MLKLIIVIIANKAYVVVVKEAAPVIAPFLQYILTQYKTGQVPSDCVTANVSPVFKNEIAKSHVTTDRFL